VLHADLTRLAIVNDMLHWAKPAGAPGALAIRGASADGLVNLSSISVETAGLSASGTGVLTTTGQVKRLEFKRVRIGETTDLRLEATPTTVGAGFDLALAGHSLDVRTKELLAKTAPPLMARKTPVRVTFDLDEIFLFKALHATHAVGYVDFNPDGSREGRLTGLMEGAAPFELKYAADEAGHRAWISATNAGDFLRSLRAFDNGYQGTLDVDFVVGAGVAGTGITGTLEIDDFVVRDAPVLAQILSAGTLIGLLDVLHSGGITFRKVKAKIRRSGSTWFIDDGVAYGPNMGLTVVGRYRSGDPAEIDLAGVVSPAYLLSHVLDNVPVLGRLLTGGEGEGIVAIAYSVKGPVAAPRVGVRPLSVLTPGILRKFLPAVGTGPSPADPQTRSETGFGTTIR
jgi:hypothetical protein